MRILIDISHPAHANFFKHVPPLLEKEGHTIIISVLNRGKLKNIVQKEYSKYLIIPSGNYRSNKFSIIFEANILRFFRQIYNILRYRIDFGLSVGSFTLGAAMKLIGRKNLQFDDDPERKLNVYLERITATRLLFPPIVKEKKNIKTFNALKEWSYLSPKYFKPDPKVINVYNLKLKSYIFIREVQTKSFNYINQNPNIVLSYAHLIPLEFPVILSLEDKSLKEKYPSHWIILNEPVEDIHSIIYFSKMVISSGDSMAREGAQLGVPSIYCGERMMKANDLIIRRGMLLQMTMPKVPEFVQQLWVESHFAEQEEFRNELMNEWSDIPVLVINTMLENKN